MIRGNLRGEIGKKSKTGDWIDCKTEEDWKKKELKTGNWRECKIADDWKKEGRMRAG